MWFPRDILEEILEELHSKENIKNCSLVCREWNTITRNPRFNWILACEFTSMIASQVNYGMKKNTKEERREKRK